MTFFDLRFRSLFIQVLFLAFSVSSVSYAQQIERSWYHLTTGNGHGFQVFDLSAGRVTDFLEHPYRFVAPPDERRDGGIGRRDLAFDIYFGLAVGDERRWLTNLSDAAYEAESHIFKATTRVDDVDVVVRYFSPFGLEANAMVMVIELRNTGDSPVDVSAFAKANMKLGQGRPDPGGENEEIRWNGDYGVETGPGGGHVIYVPIGGEVQHDCGADAAMFEQVRAGQALQNRMGCDGNDQVLVTGSSSTIEPGQSFWWGQAILFVNDNPNEPQANDFRDDRTVADIWAAWTTFRAEQDPEGLGAEAIYTSALAEIEAWRVAPEALGLETLTSDEVKVWRQSETVLRMGQVMEPIQLNRRNRGMFLAALPIGEWHTGWVRDGAYAIVSQAMNGHVDEARWGIDFLLGAWAGFFSSDDYLGQDYRISSVRYYGNGKEEGDFNRFGPNVETDGFGLTLWAARAYLHYSCDQDWLNQETLHGDTVFEALTAIAEDIDEATENDLPLPECSIWEVHWDHRKVFTYTAATMIRGFYDFAAIAELAGRDDLASYYRQRADDILEASKFFLINPRTNSFAAALEVAASDVYVDGSTVEMLHWGFVTPDDPIFQGTLQYYERLLTSAGGYRRLEERLSLNGEAQAGTYDLSEWVLLDLRIGEVFRMAGNEARADELLNKVTQSALANDLLVPELYLPDQYAVFTGVVPMVGYGAGAWQMAQLEKAGLGAPKADASWARCEQVDPDPMGGAGGSAGAGGEAGAGGSAGEMMGTGGAGGTPNDTGAGGVGGDVAMMPEPAAPLDPLAGDDSATFCATHSGGGQPIGLLLLVLCLGLFRRSQSARAGGHHV